MDRDGRIVWEVSGVLFDKILEILIGTRRIFFKGNLDMGNGLIAM
jgi:hypothetical protein